jgi:YD repeat-containing protein
MQGTTTLSRTYGGRGRLKTFTTADGDLIQYLYDANHNSIRFPYLDGKHVNYIYNSPDLLVTVTDWSAHPHRHLRRQPPPRRQWHHDNWADLKRRGHRRPACIFLSHL